MANKWFNKPCGKLWLDVPGIDFTDPYNERLFMTFSGYRGNVSGTGTGSGTSLPYPDIPTCEWLNGDVNLWFHWMRWQFGPNEINGTTGHPNQHLNPNWPDVCSNWSQLGYQPPDWWRAYRYDCPISVRYVGYREVTLAQIPGPFLIQYKVMRLTELTGTTNVYAEAHKSHYGVWPWLATLRHSMRARNLFTVTSQEFEITQNWKLIKDESTGEVAWSLRVPEDAIQFEDASTPPPTEIGQVCGDWDETEFTISKLEPFELCGWEKLWGGSLNP